VPGNGFDTRVFVVGEKTVALRRFVRKHDFRASGSGMPDYRRESHRRTLRGRRADRSRSNSGHRRWRVTTSSRTTRFRVVEISYGSPARLYDGCPGYWDRHMVLARRSHRGRRSDHGDVPAPACRAASPEGPSDLVRNSARPDGWPSDLGTRREGPGCDQSAYEGQSATLLLTCSAGPVYQRWRFALERGLLCCACSSTTGCAS